MLNPLEYDLAELRAVAGVHVPDGAGRAGDEWTGESAELARPLPAADLVTWARQYRELAVRDGGADDVDLPLPSVPTSPSGVLLTLEWLDFLVYRAGVHGALAALDYYRDVRWLSERAERELRDYLGGLDSPGGCGVGLDALDVRDHRTSLLYVTRLVDGFEG